MRVRIRVFGLVQGVGYRHYVKQLADSYGLKGWVRNMEDGSVEALFDGKEEDVNFAVEMCRRGPSSASVERFEAEFEEDAAALREFDIVF